MLRIGDVMNSLVRGLWNRNRFRCFLFFLVLLLTLGSLSTAATLSSPDGRLVLTVETAADAGNPPAQRLVYQVVFQGKPVIEPSALRLDFEGQPSLGTDVHIVKTTASSEDQTYRLVTGKASLVRNHYNALRMDLEEPGGMGRKLAIEARAYDDAVAFRYAVPEQNAMSQFLLTKESTEFRLAKDATAYALVLPNFRSGYESEYLKLPVSAL